MELNEAVSEVRGSESVGDNIRPSAPESDSLEIRELQIASLEDVTRLLQLYASVQVPREPGDVFLHHLTERRDAWFVEIGDVGLAYLTNIIPGYVGTFHLIFWDQKLWASRVDAVQRVLESAVQLFDLKKINATTLSKPLGDFLKKVGFSWEGKIRRGTILGGEMVDVHLHGITTEEVACLRVR